MWPVHRQTPPETRRPEWCGGGRGGGGGGGGEVEKIWTEKGEEEGEEEEEGGERLSTQNTALLQKNRTGIDYPAYTHSNLLNMTLNC